MRLWLLHKPSEIFMYSKKKKKAKNKRTNWTELNPPSSLPPFIRSNKSEIQMAKWQMMDAMFMSFIHQPSFQSWQFHTCLRNFSPKTRNATTSEVRHHTFS